MCCLKKFSVFFVIMTLEALMRIGNGESFTPKVVEVVKALLCTNMKATQSHSEDIASVASELTTIVRELELERQSPFLQAFNDDAPSSHSKNHQLLARRSVAAAAHEQPVSHSKVGPPS